MIKYLIAFQLLCVGLALAAPATGDEQVASSDTAPTEQSGHKCSHPDHHRRHAMKPEHYAEHCQKLSTSHEIDNCLAALTGDGIYWIKEVDETLVGLGAAFKHVLVRDREEISKVQVKGPRKTDRNGSEHVRIASKMIPKRDQTSALNKAYRDFVDDINAADSDYKFDKHPEVNARTLPLIAKAECDSYLAKFEPVQQTVERAVEAANRDYVNTALKTNKYLMRALDAYYFCQFAKSNKYGDAI